MMEIDDLDSAKCQKSRRRDMMGIFGMFNEEKDKKPNSDLLLHTKKEQKRAGRGVRCSSLVFHFSRERERTTSL